MASVTRTFKTFELSAYVLDDSNPPEVNEVAHGACLDTSMNERKARIAFRDMGVALPKHSMVKWQAGEEVTYTMDVDTFIEHAEPVLS